MLKRIFIFAAIASILIASGPPVLAKGEDIIRIKKDIEIPRDMVANDVIAISGSVTVSGRVEGNVVALGGSVTLKKLAYVGGDIIAIGGAIVKDPSAEVRGQETHIYIPCFIPCITTLMKGGWLAVWAALSVLVLLGFLGLAVLLAALVPDHMGRTVAFIEKSFVLSLLWGLLWIMLIVPIAILLAISIIGIILIPLEILLAALALLVGYIASAIFVGKNVLASFKSNPPPFVDALLGILVLFLIGFIPVLGAIVKALFLIAGFGAVIATRFGTVK